MMKQKESVDCICFSFNHKEFVLPTVAYAELGVLHDYCVQIKDFCLGNLIWRGFTLPLIRPDLTKSTAEETHPKFAVLNALGVEIPFFAIVINNQPTRVKINPQDLTWHDESKTLAMFTTSSDVKEFVLLDLKALSQAVEKIA